MSQVLRLRQAKNELERKVQDQEEELDEQAGTIQQLEQVRILLFVMLLSVIDLMFSSVCWFIFCLGTCELRSNRISKLRRSLILSVVRPRSGRSDGWDEAKICNIMLLRML